MKKILVTGAGGFIGGHLVRKLLEQHKDLNIVAVDQKNLANWYQISEIENIVGDLKNLDFCYKIMENVEIVYNLAADMGGMGFIEKHKADCMLSSIINTNLLLTARDAKALQYFFASSACVYNASKQINRVNPPLKEDDAYPADPEDGYGWEKLFGERMCRHFSEDFGLDVRIARFHNIYGPKGTFDGGREKAPAAICRKVISAIKNKSYEINIWGDGEQTRSFTYISDGLDGIQKLMESSFSSPLNIGSAELVSINQLVSIVEGIAGVKLKRTYDLSAPKGVMGRSSDNTLCKAALGWEPKVTLIDGMTKTYQWIYSQME
jgi:nucleoside-diphosphate-sugar epimerase